MDLEGGPARGSSALTQKPDILVFSPRNELQLAVEVKTKRNASDEWTARLRQNLITHSILPKARYFLLALPDRLWLWRDTETPEALSADYVVPTADALRPYLQHWREEFPGDIEFEMIVRSWIMALAHSRLTKDTAPPGLAWVFDSGLYDSIRFGSVDGQAVA